jgi:RimJ/RimL family protein N-acetyltransferase
VRWTFLIRERATGAVVGDTEVFWHPERPSLVWQGFTGVLAAHRNQGLGRWLKAAMMEQILRDLPKAYTIRTGNADSNAPMRNINDALGYRPFSRTTEWQVPLGKMQTYLEMR